MCLMATIIYFYSAVIFSNTIIFSSATIVIMGFLGRKHATYKNTMAVVKIGNIVPLINYIFPAVLYFTMQ
jgi:hypothetical protein